MDKYAIVGCQECKYAWIVQDQPKRTECGRCESSFVYHKLRKFYTTDSSEKARMVRGRVQANLNGYEAEFEDALEEGVLDEVDWKDNPTVKSLSTHEKILEILRDEPETWFTKDELKEEITADSDETNSDVETAITKLNEDGKILVSNQDISLVV